MPTHASGDGGYPREMGFGHEEWNFQLEDAVDGVVFGYLYYTPSPEILEESRGRFRIGFWSMHPDTRARLIVGVYNDAAMTTAGDFETVDRAFSKRGIYERRAHELAVVVPALSFDAALAQVRRSVQEHLLNFKCRTEDVVIPPQPVPIHDVLGGKRVGERFTTPTFVPDFQLSRVRRRSAAGPAGHAVLAEDAYYRESPASLERIIRRHNALSNRFAAWLESSGFDHVDHHRNAADVTFSRRGAECRAELKTCYGVGSTKAIREALGQLLEYNLYPGKNQASLWAIIIDERPSRHDIEYLLVLKRQLKLPLSLGWKERDGFVFPEGLELE